MNPGHQIKYLEQEGIDKEKWDACISRAPNGLIYAYSFYLDHLSKHWDALILGNYESVMPLTWNKKFGLYYLYQPAFTAAMGVFGKNINEELIKNFLNSIPKKFRLIEIPLNDANNFPAAIEGYYPRINYVLDLNKPYDELYKAYRDNHKRNISKASQLGCTIKKEILLEEIINLNEKLLTNVEGTKPADYINFKKLFDFLKNSGKAKTYGIIDRQNKLLASAVFFFSHNRTYYIMAGNHPDGKTLGASHALIDAFIKDHANQNLILDFEGSDIRNLAFFYSGFGAKEEIYPAIKLNKLPWYVKLIKK